MKIVVTGATGLIGRSLCRLLAKDGHTIVALSRKPEDARGLAAATAYKWDPIAGPPPLRAFQDAESVIHLAGEPIAARRWTREQKRRIRDSRVIGTRNLIEGLRQAQPRPLSLISSSAIGFYGNRGDEAVDESSSAGTGFLADVCLEWETEAERAIGLPMRVVRVRTGVVLGTDGGALKKMLPAFKLGVGGPLGAGNQWFSWIHIADMVGILRHALITSSLSGAINATAPEPVTNAEFTRELARVLHRPAFLKAPEFVLRLALGEMAEMLLAGQRVIPKVAQHSGYKFQFQTLRIALEALLGNKGELESEEKTRAAGE
jgi:uncharacterized protein (TIGR01777 family)